MFNIAIAFAYQPRPLSNKVAIITNAGGPGVLTTDAAIHAGLKLASFSEETTQLFRRSLPSTANIKNPVDVIGDARADRYCTAITGAMNDPDVGGIFVILTPQSMTDIETIAREIVKVTAGYTKPIYASFMGEADVHVGVDILQQNKIPHYILPESMCHSFSSVYHFNGKIKPVSPADIVHGKADKEAAAAIFCQAVEKKRPFLAEDEAAKILDAYQIPVKPGYLTTSPEEAAESARKIGFPVVLKVISDQILHKYDVKGIVLNLNTPEMVDHAYRTMMKDVGMLMPEAVIRGIYVTSMIPPGAEVILGMKRDASFGPVIMFGLGGIFVELYKDVSFRVPPLTREDANSMMHEIRAFRMLDGYRGMQKRDVNSIMSAILQLSQLVLDFPQIRELDINPLIALEEGKGCFAADVKILL